MDAPVSGFALKNIRHRYAGEEVLRVDDWDVRQGDHWLVLGPSGSGKTTLLHVVAGILPPSEGSVSISGEDLSTMSASELDRFRGKTVGIVFQRLHMISSLTVLENLLLAQYLAGARQDTQAARLLLAALGIADKARRRPAALSFGQLQRAAVARAVVNNPRIILADEPTSSLDDRNAEATAEVLIEQARSCSATLVIATHDRRIRNRFQHQLTLGGGS